ncbi:hypothetical protein WJX72_008825 [[Myrmecia] bisecta]|uniref:Uncharacterized protein n=1 Tax=[Myrmecia] bisecta TaxID=41462 RepID=A0AAW1PTG8_9CHLO
MSTTVTVTTTFNQTPAPVVGGARAPGGLDVEGPALESQLQASCPPPPAINNFMVFLVSGLTLRTKEFTATLSHWVGVLYGFAAILAITPCLGFGARAIPFQPPEFSIGLAIFCVVPTTLGVGVALTAASKGNQALALLFTIGTNLLGDIAQQGLFAIPAIIGQLSQLFIGSLLAKYLKRLVKRQGQD